MLCFLERDEKGSLFLKEHRNSWRVPPKKRIFSLCLWHSWITILYCWNGHFFFGRASCLFVLGVGGWVGFTGHHQVSVHGQVGLQALVAIVRTSQKGADSCIPKIVLLDFLCQAKPLMCVKLPMHSLSAKPWLAVF